MGLLNTAVIRGEIPVCKEISMEMNNMNELYHHGILGQKWGVRRFQNPDGSLTPAGKKRFKSVSDSDQKMRKHQEDAKWLLKSNIENEKEEKSLTKQEMKQIGHLMDKESIDLAKKWIKENDENIKRYNKYLTDIDNGTLKAGRDYITAFNDFTLVEDGIVFKNPDSETKKFQYSKKDFETYNKTGIRVTRDDLNRVTNLKADNANRKQIRKINKMQKKINKNGDY